VIPTAFIKKHFGKFMIGSIIGLAIGFYILEEVATWEELPLGQVFYIVLGCVLIAVSGIFMIAAIKVRFFPKKRKRRRSKPIFLEDERKNKRNPDQTRKQ